MSRSLRAARLATFAFFALNGFVLGMWIVHIPAVEHRTGISHAVLGSLLLLLGAGAFLGMQFAGPLTDRLGSRLTVPAGGALCSAALALPGAAGDAWTLGAALFVLGFGNGCLDVAMNTHAVQVERAYGRPVMSAFHAVFSVGGVLASLAGALTISLGWGTARTLTAVAVLGLAVTALATPALLPRPEPAALPSPARPDTKRRTPPRVWALAGLAFALMLCEGVANDWSVLHLRDVLDAPAAAAALAYGAFATAMTAGRLVTDRVVARTGPVLVVRYGTALAALGLAAGALADSVPVALAGWTLFGVGLSGCIPQLFSAAGHADQDSSGVNVSRVAGLGYLGMLAGPAVIGPLTRLMPLNLALLLPVALCLGAAGAAGMLRTGPARAAGQPSRTADARS
ncbi:MULTISPECIES: MFS transporter [unclassified Streptomyces]|uniref:MFS transporter n=1 Tax=unclassified Streptomyces TaxID=2593676 RepID=UPI001BE574C6|nr:MULTISPECIES: MFS transporter [unclassified Streptomyces]MBT2404236.1 MFS transporter [Streptomyces sp. ISL-21]MBT2612913.1 MFS transporter [Streptomyces sp. ISL-87]